MAPLDQGDEDALRRLKAVARRRQPVTDQRLKEVAQIYRAAFPDAPTKAVSVELNMSQASASRLVGAARKRGFLPKTEKRKAKA